MDTIKAGKSAIEFIRLCYDARRPPLLMGSHGVGKSELLRQAANELGVDFICRDLSLMEPTDLVGLPKSSGGRTCYLPPSFLPTSGKGILAFEELNRADRCMQASCLQLLTTGKLNDYQLPSGFLPAATINPPDGDYEVLSLDAALLSRFVQVMLRADQEEWLAWASCSGVHADVIQYVASDDSIFEHPESNPRAWKYVSDLLHVADKKEVLPETLRCAVLGLVGDKRGAAFLRSRKQRELPLTAESILADYARHRGMLVRWVSEGKLDLVKASLLAVKTHLQPKGDFELVRADRTRSNHLGRFLEDLPGDLQQQARSFFAARNYGFPTKNTRKKGAARA